MDWKNADLNLLRAFDALISERNVSRAAEKLFLSQPATSALLARLREVLQDPLLVRSGRGMVPTERALALAEPVRKVLLDIQGILQPQQAFDPQTSERTFTVAATEYVLQTLLPAFPQQLDQTAPRIRVALVAPNHDTMVRQMESGMLDIAIVNQGLVPPQLRSSRFLRDDFCVIARKRHPHINKRLSLTTFCNLPHVVVSPRNSSFVAQTDESLKAMGLQRFVQLSVPYFTMAADVVAHSNMIAVYPRRLASSVADRVQVLKLPLAVSSFALGMCWHERSQRDPAHQWLRSTLMQCLR